MAKKRKTGYYLGKEENFYSPLLKLDKEEGGEWITLDGENAEQSCGEQVMIETIKVNPEGGGDTYDQLGIKLQMMQAGTKKTTVVNFKDVYRTLHCQPKHLLTFLSVELGGVTASIDCNNRLVLGGKVQQKQIEHALREYFKEYVECRTCLSPKTVSQKENGLYCETCHSRSVAGIKTKFHVATAKKANMESFEPNTKKTKKKKKHAKSQTRFWICFCILLFIAVFAGVLILYPQKLLNYK